MENNNNGTENNYKIEMQELYAGFKLHLDITGNSKVFFSGKYGTGKTTFLKDFFEYHSGAYDVYHLYPINYQVKTNDDVIDLLKYDILVKLLQNHPDAFKESKVSGVHDHLFLIREFIKNNFTINGALQKTVGYMEDYLIAAESVLPIKISQLGRPIQDLLKLDKQFQEFKNQYQKGDFAKVETFLEEQDSHEPDGLSFIISKKVQELKGDKQSVLILDDLDRMDPEHIFRIFNVFSAFHEQDDGGNKFGFDRVVVVGDINNIRHIFGHFYGPKTDFEGYVDKFYSQRWYEFQTKEIISSAVTKLILKFGTDSNGNVLQGFQNRDYFIRGLLQHILTEAVYSDHAPNLRQLTKLDRFSSVILKECDYREKSLERTRNEEIERAIFFVLRVLKQIAQTDEALEKLLKSIKEGVQRDRAGEGFYRTYSKPLLFTVLKAEAKSGPISWGKYQVTVDEENSGFQWGPMSENEDVRSLFFDLLTEVVSKKLYE